MWSKITFLMVLNGAPILASAEEMPIVPPHDFRLSPKCPCLNMKTSMLHVNSYSINKISVTMEDSKAGFHIENIDKRAFGTYTIDAGHFNVKFQARLSHGRPAAFAQVVIPLKFN